MTTDELHPEELLARAAARPLGPDEAADLRAHLRRCPACALQLDLRAAVDRALAPADADYEVGARAVERLLASEGRALPPLGTARRARGAHTAARVALVAVMLVGTGVGAAALVHRARTGRFWGAPAPADEGAPQTPVAEVKRAHEAKIAVAEPTEALAAAEAQPAVVEATAPPPVMAPPVPAPRQVAPRARRSVAEPVAEEAAEPPAVAPAAGPAPEAPANGAALLFQAAERTRRAGDAAGAERLYARLAAEFPGTREEIASRALRGQLLFDELGRPSEALVAFEAYLRAQPQGMLAEETRAARAETLGRLGRQREEGAAWRELLASYPRSIYAARARERLAALAQAGE